MLTRKEFEALVNDLIACERSVDWYNLHGTFDDSEERAIKRRDIARAKPFAVFEPLEQAVYMESLAKQLNDQLMECFATREMYRIRCDDLYKAGMEHITELKDASREMETP